MTREQHRLTRIDCFRRIHGQEAPLPQSLQPKSPEAIAAAAFPNDPELQARYEKTLRHRVAQAEAAR